MNFIKRNVLITHSDLIIKDLHGDVIEILRDKGVLTSVEFENINSQSKHEERNKKFLDILYTKPEGFYPFLDSLKDWYSWIEKRLRDTLTGRPLTLDAAIALSEVPAIPLINVSRVDLLNKVREDLRNLKLGEYVVLHGMSGCGKSSLAAEAIHHEILLDCFQGRVIWLSCGHDVKDDDDENEVLFLQIELNETICEEELVSDVKRATINSLRINLQKRFQGSDFREGLVVLDDVNSHHVIEALKIGCKTLVTTIDKDVMKKQAARCKFVEVSESFKEEESMQYLAKCVNVPVDKLPPQAREIHRHGKGHPLIMSLIGADLRDHLDESQRNEAIWQEWLNVLLNKEYGKLARRSFSNEPLLLQTLEICINNLEPEMRTKYQDFALFVEDVNIKTEVLEILWNLPKTDVKKIMREFYTKSLVVRKYSEAQNSYVYGIHDLLRFFLRKRLDDEALRDLHRKLISRYTEACGGDPSQLPRNDNYFFYYIGYHIANSKLYTMFQEWYLNLDFIEAKLKVAGPGDLLLDYKRYSAHFIDGLFESAASAVSKRLSDFVRFVETAGLDVRRNNGPDIVQLALQEPHDSDVYTAALRLAQSRPQKTYLRFQLGPSKSKAAPQTIQTREKVSAACFSNNEDNLIVAFESGTIQIVNRRGHKRREYEGHASTVTRLNVASQKNVFLSVSSNSVKVWKLPDLDFSVLPGDQGDRSPSPSQRQDNFAELFTCKSPDKRQSWFTALYQRDVQWANFSQDGTRFAVCCTDDNRVEIYEHTKPEYLEKQKQPWMVVLRISLIKPTSCAFSADGKFLAIGGFPSCLRVHHIDSNTAKFAKILAYPILALFALPGIKFGVLTKTTLSVWDVENTETDDKKPVPCLKDYAKGESELYTSCAATLDGSVVAVATSNSKILICDPSDGSVLREIHESTGNLKYLAMDETKDRRLLACYDDSTVRVWKLGEVNTDRPATMRSNFVVAWAQQDLPTLVAPTLKSCVKKITDLKESKDLPVPVSGDINICGISDCGEYIVVGTPAGQVFLHREGGRGTMLEILTVKGRDSITKLSVKKIRKRIFVVVGLKRSLKVWTSKVELEGADKDEDSSVYKQRKTYELLLSDRLVDSFILPTGDLISVSRMGNIKKWCMKRGKMVGVMWHGRLDDVQLCGADLSGGNVLATLDARRKTLNLYNVGDATVEEQGFKLEGGTPACCSFSFDGNKLAVGFANGLIQLWDMMSLEHRTVYTGVERIECVCVSRTGVIGAAAAPSRVVLVTATGAVGQARLNVSRVVMSPDDATIITVDMDGHLHLIDQFNTSNCNSVVLLSRTFSNALKK